jgi:hypothetical protein
MTAARFNRMFTALLFVELAQKMQGGAMQITPPLLYIECNRLDVISNDHSEPCQASYTFDQGVAMMTTAGLSSNSREWSRQTNIFGFIP